MTSRPPSPRDASRGPIEIEALLDGTTGHLPDVTAAASRDSTVEARFLGDYLDRLVSCIRTERRLDAEELDDVRSIGSEVADAGPDLASLLDLYLSATWRFWKVLESGLGDATPEAVGAAAATVLRAADDVTEALAQGYQSAQRLAIRREEAVRREFVDDLLSGSAASDALQERAARFGFNLAGAHLVSVARTGRSLIDAGPVHRGVETHVLTTFGGRDVVVATKDGSLVCVVPDGQGDPAPELLRIVEGTGEGTWQLGMGRSHPGPGGIVRSYGEARQCLELADRLGITAPIVRFDELLPYLILGREQQASRELVERVLGNLRSARGGPLPLIETLEAYLAESANVTATARRLHLSPRAVAYRLDRIARLTGFSPKVPEERFLLELALRAARLLGFE